MLAENRFIASTVAPVRPQQAIHVKIVGETPSLILGGGDVIVEAVIAQHRVGGFAVATAEHCSV
jgi:hypothetical protein